MTDIIEPLFQIGDFARNTIHGYVDYLIYQYVDSKFFYGVIVGTPEENKNGYPQIGTGRSEIIFEMTKEPATFDRIEKAKKYLTELNTTQPRFIDNLTYVELLYKLNEQERALKNENADPV